MIVVDTNVASELMRPAPSPAVLSWVRSCRPGELAMTAVTVAEIRYGIERLPESRRKVELRATADELLETFAEEVLPFDARAAVEYAAVASGRERSGRPISGFDAQIASICLARHARLATRNVKDFDGTGVDVVDPWAAVG